VIFPFEDFPRSKIGKSGAGGGIRRGFIVGAWPRLFIKVSRDKSLSGLGVPKDIVVVTESDIKAYSNDPSLVIYPALREGKELYRAVS